MAHPSMTQVPGRCDFASQAFRGYRLFVNQDEIRMESSMRTSEKQGAKECQGDE